MFVPKEVGTFEEPITGQNCFGALPGLKERGVIANSQEQSTVGNHHDCGGLSYPTQNIVFAAHYPSAWRAFCLLHGRR
jgi:hypothetical protein